MNFSRIGIAATLALTLMLAGCQSKQDAAIDAAKKQAAATGQPQQVVSVDKSGNTVTTTVQPPAPGQTAQIVTTTVVPPVATAANQPAVAPGQTAIAPGQPAIAGQSGEAAPPQPEPVATPGSAPVIRPAGVNIPAGTPLAIRITQRISVKTSRPGDRFDGEVAEPVADSTGRIAIPKSTPVGGVIVAAHRRGHFKGSSILELRLTSLTLNGTRYRIETSDLTRTKKGKGRRSAAFIGGGSGLGMLVGGVASGGVGLLVGGLAGAGAGTAVGGLTGNRDIEIPSESLVRFRLADDLVVRPY
jgi:hypothetical protein